MKNLYIILIFFFVFSCTEEEIKIPFTSKYENVNWERTESGDKYNIWFNNNINMSISDEFNQLCLTNLALNGQYIPLEFYLNGNLVEGILGSFDESTLKVSQLFNEEDTLKLEVTTLDDQKEYWIFAADNNVLRWYSTYNIVNFPDGYYSNVGYLESSSELLCN